MEFRRYPSRIFTSSTYLIKASLTDAFLFDIGEIESVLEDLDGLKVRALFLTHCHYDHIYFIDELAERFPEMIIYGHKNTLESLADPKANLSFYHDSPVCYTGSNMIALEAKENSGELDVAGVFVRWYATPGHHPGALSYKVDKYLITGDSYIPGYQVVTKLKGGDKVLASKSMDFLRGIAERENLIVAPGHGKEMDMDEARYYDESQQNPTIPPKKS